ncbi:MAG: M67 family peptidase [Dehalococcoidia bacterium]|nr:M67 family peptidase [Dehalococcoidia bacterium]
MFQLPRRLADEMTAHALRDDPNECCGLLAGDDEGGVTGVFPAENAARSPFRYVIDSKELFRLFNQIEWGEQSLRVIGNYHSHTHSEAFPSPTDVNEAHLGPGAVYLIISLRDPQQPVIRAFLIDENSKSITEEALEILPD